MAYTSDAARPLTRPGEAPVRLRFTDLPDCEAPVARLRIEGTVLDGVEIAALAAALERSFQVKGALSAFPAAYPRLAARAGALATSARCCARSPAGFCRTAASPTMPAWRCPDPPRDGAPAPSHPGFARTIP